jgi:hypothetical protein
VHHGDRGLEQAVKNGKDVTQGIFRRLRRLRLFARPA